MKVKYKKLSKKAYHVTTGTFYSTSYLKKANHLGVHYQSTTFYTYQQATVTRANGSKAVYYYVKSSNGKVKGWIWHSYLKKGAVSNKKTATTATKSSNKTAVTTPATSTTGSTTSTTSATAPITALQAGGTSSATSVAGGSTSTGTSTTPASDSYAVSIEGPIADGSQVWASETVKVKQGDTAFTALQKLCRDNNMQMGYTGSGTSVYVSSINYKGAGTNGSGGGWLYSVNGAFPNHSAGGYDLQGGETIVWMWTQNSGDRGYNF
ncbi:hypothetical protein FD14_GL000714 [Secundilactobacillus similis DSM 23365 = JCM 2765]|uniref:Transcobalamin-like C-terminal domain-containing protein n=1 Tax=Secundilactobacillus similis DSM 23365 = JCM 2765 TaxID=1423804 RepID=A0A0R2FF83_9LACO|nr:hypothetical protein FD14_GL000714 [Secundilactobacillus similis DSM 23365 = JCM 2765]